MRQEKNYFGEAFIYEEADVQGKIYTLCCACMSIYSEFLSWANAHPERMTKNPAEADSIIVLSCQVTELSILNDIRKLEKIMMDYPGRDYYICGCLANRFDIDLPEGARRLETMKRDYNDIADSSLIDFDKPFWVPDFKEDDSEKSDGHLFRNMYPLRIGVGCSRSCTYCTIRITRGASYELESAKLESEFLAHDNVILIADSPSANQLKEWCKLAEKHNKPFSVRNVEPHTACEIKEELLALAEKKLLNVFHCPVQSANEEMLKDMKRSVKKTFEAIELMRELKAKGVFIATNIIIDYKDFPDTPLPSGIFDYVSWNPYWHGKWNREDAEKKFERYFGKDAKI